MASLAEFQAAGLSLLELRHLFVGLLQAEPPRSADQPLSLAHANALWTALLLKGSQPPLSPEQRTLVLESLLPRLASGEGSLQLIFLDGLFFTHSGLQGFIRLDTGESLVQLGHTPAVCIAYNLAEFFRRQNASPTHADHTTTDDRTGATGSGKPEFLHQPPDSAVA